MERKNAWEKYPEGKKREEVFQFAEDYRKFISECKTERECTTEFAKRAEKAGFVNLDEVLEKGTKLKAGDRVYANNMGKGIAMFVIGKKGLEAGMNILGAHIDSPRMDLKQDPLYEDTDFAMLDTHYYGGIKKYQWVTLPLALHGVIAKKDGTVVKVNVGDKPGDPVFGVSDLLIHLSGEQLEKKAAKVIEGENLDLIIGSIPAEEAGDDKEAAKEKVKANIMKILAKEYDIEEEDFLSAEIEVVPAGEARDYGFDRSIIMGYGHDDRVCAYTSLAAMMTLENVKNTAVCILSDKEEIGSMGNTGMESHMFDYFVSELLNKTGENRPNLLDKVFCFSRMLSADVDAGFDPLYASVSDRTNAAFLGRGIGLNKYTGARGKSGASDANAEYVAWVRNVLEKNDIKYQVAELGKVDIGGGGTIAYILANKGTDVIDCGVPVLSMHAPYEVTSKFDIYTAYRTYKAFWEE